MLPRARMCSTTRHQPAVIGGQMRVLKSLAFACAIGSLGSISTFAQNSNTTCTTVYNTTHCNTTTTPDQQGVGKLGAIIRGYEQGRAAAQAAQPPAPTPLPPIPAPPTVASSAADSDPKAPFTLACRISTRNQTFDKTFLVEPALGMVNHHASVISDTSILEEVTEQETRGVLHLKSNHIMRIEISRITGTLSAAYDGAAIGVGSCVKAAGRVF